MTDNVLEIPVTFEVITADSVKPGPETGLEFTFVDFEGNTSMRANSVRPVGFEVGHGGSANIAWLNAGGSVDRMPIDALRGIDDLRTSSNPLEPEVSFRYYKQFLGAEAGRRVLRLTGIAYGVHEGHMGDSGKGVAAEKPTWYMVGDQIGQIDEAGKLTRQEPAERFFPFTRIMNGPVGDPTNHLYRKQHGIY